MDAGNGGHVQGTLNGMENYGKIKKGGQCGIHNLANALRDKNILKYADNEDYWPCGMDEVNRILTEEAYPFRMMPIIVNVDWGMKVDDRQAVSLIEGFVKKDGGDSVRAFIMTVQTGHREWHLHAVTLLSHMGRYYFSDPMDRSFVALESLGQVFAFFRYVQSIYSFYRQGLGFVALDPGIYTGGPGAIL